MDYRKITNKKSKQYKLIKELEKSHDGFLRDKDGYIAVALGSRYGNIGDKFIIKFNDNSKIKVIKADEKSDKHTMNGCYHISDGSMVEVIICNEKFKKENNLAYKMGDVNYTNEFNGNIKQIYKVKN